MSELYQQMYDAKDRKLYKDIFQPVIDKNTYKGTEPGQGAGYPITVLRDSDKLIEGLHYVSGNLANLAHISALTPVLEFLSKLQLNFANNPAGINDILELDLPEILHRVETTFKVNYDNHMTLERILNDYLTLK